MAQAGDVEAVHDEQKPALAPQSKYSRRVALRTILGRSDGGLSLVGERVVVGGWVKSSVEIVRRPEESPPLTLRVVAPAPPTADLSCSELLMTRVPVFRRFARMFAGPLVQKLEPAAPVKVGGPAPPSAACLQINDGSCTANIQIRVESSVCSIGQVTPIGTCILVEGVMKQPTTPGRHSIELVAEKVLHVGLVDPRKYPIGKRILPMDLLRTNPHLRSRTTTIASIARIRGSLTNATHNFFQNNGFVNVHMPVITTTTGARTTSEMFQVTTLLNRPESTRDRSGKKGVEAVSIETVKAAIREKSMKIEELKRSDSNRDALASALQDLRKANELAVELEGRQTKEGSNGSKAAELDFNRDYFSRPAYLTMSAGLHLESHACALGSVYSLGPVFQAKPSQSKRHLAEMWMLDVNMAFAELEDAICCAEDYLKFICQWVLRNNLDDLTFTSKRIDKNSIQRIRSVGSGHFEKISYTEAVEALKKVEGKAFQTKVEWGLDLSEEHERHLVDEIYKKPIIIYDHPKNVKPFFMRLKDDQKTVSSFDIILPLTGALVRGGQQEERIDVITQRLKEFRLPQEEYEWYLDLRRHGTAKHSGFSLGIEHMVMFLTGIDDARDAIPFPRTHGFAHP